MRYRYNGKDLQLAYASPLFEQALLRAGIDEKTRQTIVQKVMREGSCQQVLEVPASIRQVFVVSSDISAEDHVRMQAALQAFVDNSLSKTINFPEDAEESDVATAYTLAWSLGCKGITVYVTGSRDKVVLETKATAEKKEAPIQLETAPVYTPADQIPLWQDTKKPRPRSLHGYTYSIETPLGKAFVTINETGPNIPFEVFINTAKAGSDTAAVSEAIGRLISYILRIASSIAPRQRLEEVLRQLAGIGGGRSMGFGPNRVRSLPDGVAHALDEYLQNLADNEHEHSSVFETSQQPDTSPAASTGEHSLPRIGDLCPECGQAAMVNEEGCHKCYACGFSEC